MKYLLAALFLVSTWLDFLTTYVFMNGVAHPEMEANPIAAWFLAHHGFQGLAWAIIAADMFVLGLLFYTSKYKKRTALTGLALATIGSNAVVLHNLLHICQQLTRN